MFEIQKRMEIAGAHRLDLPYKSKCSNRHGHNWIVNVFCKAEQLNDWGMVVDFTEIKRKIHDKLDHGDLNYVNGFSIVDENGRDVHSNPTAERLAEWVCNQIDTCYKVTVQESEGNIATYLTPGQYND